MFKSRIRRAVVMKSEHAMLENLEQRRLLTGAACGGEPLLDDFGDDAAHAQQMDSTFHAQGALLGPDDQDWFTFQAQAGEILRSRGPFEPNLTVFDATLQEIPLPYKQEEPVREYRWPLPSTGAYYVRISDDTAPPHSQTPYDPNLDLIPLDDFADDVEHAEPLDVGQVIEGHVGYQEEQDVFAFPAAEGKKYTIELTGNETPDIALINAQGESLAWDPRGSELGEGTRNFEFVAPATDRFFVTVGYDGWGGDFWPYRSDYKLQVLEAQ